MANQKPLRLTLSTMVSAAGLLIVACSSTQGVETRQASGATTSVDAAARQQGNGGPIESTASTARPSETATQIPSTLPSEWVQLKDLEHDVAQFRALPPGITVAIDEARARALASDGVDTRIWVPVQASLASYSQPRTYTPASSIAPAPAPVPTQAPRVIADRQVWIVVFESDQGLIPHPTRPPLPGQEATTTSSEPLYHKYVGVIDANSGEFLEGYFLP